MALTPEQQKLKDLKDLRAEFEAYRKDYESLSGKKMPNPFPNQDLKQFISGFKDIDEATKVMSSQIRSVRKEINALDNTFDSIKGIVKDISNELQFNTSVLKKTRQQFSKIRGIVSEIEYLNADIASASKDDIARLKQKNKAAFISLGLRKKELEQEINAERGNLTNSQIAAGFGGRALKEKQELLGLTNDEIGLEASVNNELELQEQRINNINSGLGISGNLVAGLGGFLEKIGFKGMASGVDKAKKKMEALSFELSKGGEEAVNFEGKFKVLGAGLSSLGSTLTGLFSDPLFYIGLLAKAVQKLGHLFTHIDHAVSNVGKTLGLSRESAHQMTMEMKSAAAASGDTFLNMDRMVDAQLKISKALGTNVRLTDEQLGNQARLAEFVGLQDDELANVYRSTLLTGQSQEQLYDTVVDTNDSIFTSNQLFKEASGVTGQIAMNLGNNPALIAKAVAEAKRLGITLSQAASMADSTLDFESSIAAEMEAQVLTGRNLNLNKARELAFANDLEGAAAEMLKQVGSVAEFQGESRLAQQAMAKALGLSVDELSNQLVAREANLKIEARALELAKGGVVTEQNRLQALRENQTISERLGNATKKIGDFFGGLIAPAVEFVADKLEYAMAMFGGIFGNANKTKKELDGMSEPVAEAVQKGEELKSKFSGIIDTLKSAFGTMGDYPVLSTIGAIAGGVIAFKGLKALKGKVGSLLGLKTGKLGSNPNNPMFVSMTGASSSIMDMFRGKKGPGNMLSKAKNMIKMPKMPNMLKGIGPKLLKGSGILSLVGAGVDLVGNLSSVAQNEDKGIGDALARTLDENKFMALGAAIGSVVPGVGTLIGAGIGGILDFANKQVLGEKGMVTESLDTPMAAGGIVTKPTRALVGEAGAEAVIPLREFYAKMDELINVVKDGGDVVMDGRKVGTTLQLASYKL